MLLVSLSLNRLAHLLLVIPPVFTPVYLVFFPLCCSLQLLLRGDWGTAITFEQLWRSAHSDRRTLKLLQVLSAVAIDISILLRQEDVVFVNMMMVFFEKLLFDS